MQHENYTLIFFSSLVVIAAFLFLSVEAATNQQDVDALIALHSAWSQKPSNWDTSTDPCEGPWLGIGCDTANTRVTQLLLINQDLDGTLPSAIGDLTSLTNLDLSSNPKLRGSLPTEIDNLQNIERFFVQFCNFSGTIPDVGNLTSLKFFGLTMNAFTGPLPNSIGLLKSLIWLDVSSNQLSGNLPDSTTSSGVGLDNLTNAEHFHLENNSFSGSIPPSIFNSQMSLIHLLLHSNEFTGNIPSSIGDLPHVEIIRLDSNHLNGSVPSSISAIKNLTTLQVNNNSLSGQLPDLSNNTNMQMLYLGNNNFDAALIPSWISNLGKLYLLSMDSANLIGSIPSNIFDSSPSISNVTLASNNLNGTLNLTLANPTLLLVNVTNNNLADLAIKSNNTVEILLDGNLYCETNQTQCSTLQSGTPPSPPSPTSASECSNACQEEYTINPKASTNCQCTRPVVANITFLATKTPLLIDVYNISSMEERFALGLDISSFLDNITFLSTQVVVDVISATQLTVSVFPPSNTDVWSSSDAVHISFVLKNQEIEFPGIGPLVCAFIGAPYDTVVVVNKLSTAAKIGIGIAVAVFVIAIVVIGFYAMKQRKRADKAEKLNKPFASWIAAAEGGTADIPQLKGARWFSLEEIMKCTNNFSQNNEIGEGGYGKVYKGFLSSGEKVAIKRARTDSLQGATEFKNEIELLSRVHHRNLVGLIGFCFEEGEQILVYEFMPNGTLRECLSGTTGIQMDWQRRIALALGSARGIAYLHNEANPPIIHRDIKSSNILLDDKLVAKVADFGLSKLAPTEDAVTPLSTEVKGTLGYLDPDYFMTNRLTDKSDVYSFGVVLFEMVTARLPIQGGKYVVREIRTALAQGGMDLVVKSMVDPDLREYPPKALERLVELALSCVEDSPDARPTMAEVVKEIEMYSEVLPASMDVSLEGRHAQPYGGNLPFIQQNLGTPFEYSGSYVGMNTNVEPK